MSFFQNALNQRIESKFSSVLQTIKPFLTDFKDKQIHRLEIKIAKTNVVNNAVEPSFEKHVVDLLPLFNEEFDGNLIDFKQKSLVQLNKMYFLQNQVNWLKVFKKQLTINSFNNLDTKQEKTIANKITIALSSVGGVFVVGLLSFMVK